MNLVRKGLTPARHVFFYDMSDQVGTDDDGFQLLGCTET